MSTLLIFVTVAWLVVIVDWICLEIGNAKSPGQIRVARIVLAVAMIAVPTIGWLRPGLRLTVLLARPSLDSLADQAQRGDTLAGPIQVGLLRFKRVENRYRSYPMLVLDSDPNGPTGLVRADHEPGNAWSCVHLGNGWMLFSED